MTGALVVLAELSATEIELESAAAVIGTRQADQATTAVRMVDRNQDPCGQMPRPAGPGISRTLSLMARETPSAENLRHPISAAGVHARCGRRLANISTNTASPCT
jgi:hypothetical protein